MTQRGLLLVAHGARDAQWAEPFHELARRVQQRDAALAVQLAFLEFMSPTPLQAGRALAEMDCARVDVVPLFLGAGGHVRKDLPALLAQLATAHPQVLWQLRRAIGEIDGVIDAMVGAALDATHDGQP